MGDIIQVNQPHSHPIVMHMSQGSRSQHNLSQMKVVDISAYPASPLSLDIAVKAVVLSYHMSVTVLQSALYSWDDDERPRQDWVRLRAPHELSAGLKVTALLARTRDQPLTVGRLALEAACVARVATVHYERGTHPGPFPTPQSSPPYRYIAIRVPHIFVSLAGSDGVHVILEGIIVLWIKIRIYGLLGSMK
ncbi:hypothetical protein EDC04DRAFT_3089877, partial [Pisolithus marmoratus]